MHRSPHFIGSVIQWLIAGALLTAYPATLGSLGAPSIGAIAALVAGIGLFWLLAGRIIPLPHVERASLQPIVVAALLVSLTAVAEEAIWRGFVLQALATHSGIQFALIVTTIGFAVMHLPGQGWGGVTSHLCTGTAFALALICTGQLVAAMLMHVSYNVAVAVTSLAHDATRTA